MRFLIGTLFTITTVVISASSAPVLTLVEKGKSDWRIVVGTNAIPAERYAAEGAYQIGIDEPIDEALDRTTEVMHGDLLDEGEKVRHNSDRLARVVLNCRRQALEHSTVAV